MSSHIEHILIGPKTTIRQVMEVIDEAPHREAPPGIALVVDEKKRLLGVVTDGDVRRAILRGSPLDSLAEKIMTKDPISVKANLPASRRLDEISRRVREISRSKKRQVKIEKVVIVDEEEHVVDVVNFFDLWRQSELRSKQIAVLGLGFVGLTLAVSLADVGYRVVGVDSDQKVVETLRSSRPHIHELGLESILKFHLAKNLSISTTVEREDSDVYVICVPTPIDNGKKPNLSHIREASKYLAGLLKRDDMVIVRSTVPVGTTRNFVLPILEEGSGLRGGGDFSLAMAPERTVAGQALKELRELPQIIGGLDTNSSELATNFFRRLTPTIVNVHSLEAAEMVKLVDNTYRDLTFAYANELALICDRFGLNVSELVKAANEGYTRNRIPIPSPGVGGVCLKKDPYILIYASNEAGYHPKLSTAAREVNEAMVDHVIGKIEKFCTSHGKNFRKMKVFIMGFAFKGVPETSDTRDSATLDLVSKLLPNGSTLFGYDPVVTREEIARFSVEPSSIAEGFGGADCVLVMNNHYSYAKLDIYPLLESMNKPAMFFDGWGLYAKAAIERVPGVYYVTLASS